MARTAACVDIWVANNGTFSDAFRFGVEGDTSWSFVNKTFEMEVKASRDDTTALAEYTSGDNEIVVDDLVERVLHFNVAPVSIQTDLPPGQYVYDLLMTDTVTGVVTPLMQGTLYIKQGVTEV